MVYLDDFILSRNIAERVVGVFADAPYHLEVLTCDMRAESGFEGSHDLVLATRGTRRSSLWVPCRNKNLRWTACRLKVLTWDMQP